MEGAVPTGASGSRPMRTTYTGTTAGGQSRQHNGNVYGNITYNNIHQPQPPGSAEQLTGNEHWLIERAPNALFTGHFDILSEIESGFAYAEHDTNIYVLYGIGGVGKSEIALQYACGHRQDYWGVFWIDCSTSASALRSFTLAAKRCNWDYNPGDETIETVVRELSNSKLPWLLILDNCDDPDTDYASYVPTAPNGELLMTTRLDDVRTQYGYTGSHHVRGLTRDDAYDLLLRAAGKAPHEMSRDPALSIIDQLALHPLAIIVAASLMKNDGYSLEDYSELLRESHRELLHTRPRQAQSTYGTIDETFEVSARRLYNCQEHVALALLDVLAFFDRTEVPEKIFTRAWRWATLNRLNPEEVDLEPNNFDTSKLSDEHFKNVFFADWPIAGAYTLRSIDGRIRTLRRARARLADLSLISLTEKDDGTSAIAMHPLLHSWARNRLMQSMASKAWTYAAATLALSAENDRHWRDFTFQLQPHLESCYDLQPPDVGEQFLCRTLYSFWWQLYRSQSGHIHRIVAKLQDLIPALGNSATLLLDDNRVHILQIHALALRDSGKYHEAWPVEQELLYLLEKTYVPHHMNVRRAKHNLAVTLLDVGRCEDAVRHLEELREIENDLPRDDVNRLETATTLGRAYLSLGKPENAVSILEMVLEIRRGKQSAPLQSTSRAQSELAAAFAEHGEHKPNQQAIMRAQDELAKAYCELGRPQKAVQLLEQIVTTQRRLAPAGNRELWRFEIQLCHYYLHNDQPAAARQLFGSLAPQALHRPENEHWEFKSLECQILFAEGAKD